MPSAPDPILIRPAVAADLPELGKLGAMLVAQHHGYDPQRYIAPRSAGEVGYAEFLAGELVRPEVVLLTAEAVGQAVGYVYGELEGMDWMTLRGPAGVIHDLAVSPEHRGAGLGRKLTLAGMDALERLGARQVVLSTAHQNEAAQRLFESLGFRFTLREMTRELAN